MDVGPSMPCLEYIRNELIDFHAKKARFRAARHTNNNCASGRSSERLPARPQNLWRKEDRAALVLFGCDGARLALLLFAIRFIAPII